MQDEAMMLLEARNSGRKMAELIRPVKSLDELRDAKTIVQIVDNDSIYVTAVMKIEKRAREDSEKYGVNVCGQQSRVEYNAARDGLVLKEHGGVSQTIITKNEIAKGTVYLPI